MCSASTFSGTFKCVLSPNRVHRFQCKLASPNLDKHQPNFRADILKQHNGNLKRFPTYQQNKLRDILD